MKFTRPARDPASIPSAVDIEVRRPPALPATAQAPVATRLMPVLMVMASVGMLAFYFTSGGITSRGPMFVLFPVLMVVSVLSSMVLGSRGNRRTAEIDADRRDYLHYLSALGDCADRAAADQYTLDHRNHMGPESLWHMTGSERMWQRCCADPDFTVVRIGIGSAMPRDRLVSPAPDPDDPADPVTAEAHRALLQCRVLAGSPITLALNRYQRVVFSGSAAEACVRALLCQLTVWHGPDHVRVVTVAAGHDWDWLKWLPHHYRNGRLGDPVLRFGSADAVAEACSAMTGCHVVVINPSGVVVAERPGVTVLELSARPGAAVATLTVADGRAMARGIPDLPGDLVPDALSVTQAEVCARSMAKYELSEQYSSSGVEWSALTGIDDAGSVRPEHLWLGRSGRDRLRVPVGVGEAGEPVYLDLKEAAEAGMGPHGLCIGATGAGKSEFLRTLTLGLVSAHSPAELNLVLVDFKGGATFLGFEPLRHVAAVITNLAQEAHLVARMRDALAGELTRRQELLRAAGNLAGIGEYRSAYAAGAVREPLPALLIVVDEFSELLSQYPDFAELFAAIGRLGRSLGIHLLLASQRLDEGRLRGLDSHLSYRVCLKTFSAAESRAVLGVPVAHELPALPGAAYLKTADGVLTKFRAAFVSGPTPDAAEVPARLFTAAPVSPRVLEADGPTLLQTVVDGLAGAGPPAHQVWLAPLERSPMLSELLIDRGGDNGPELCVPIGLVDDPFGQRRHVLAVDLRGSGGHLAIVGGLRSGKSTALQTVLLALSATHTADRLNIYGIDLGHGALTALKAVPHVGAVADRSDPELMHRILTEILALIRRRQGGHLGDHYDDEYGEVMLAIDGLPTLRRDFPDLEDSITTIATQGLSVGVHLLLTSSRWAELRPALKDQLGSRIELRLGDPAESEMDRRRAPLLTGRPPGRGITADGKEFVVALPQMKPTADGRQARRIEVLPTLVPLRSLGSAAIGLSSDGNRPFALDLNAEPLVLMIGDNECGKTAALRAVCRSVMTEPEAARVLVVDYRRTLLGVVEPPHLAGYAMSAASAEVELSTMTAELNSRLPGPGVTQRQLRERSWWTGPDLYVVVDDYDLVAGISGNPLLPLIDLLPHARDVGLRVVIARRSGGAARALFDPLLARMRDLGATGVLMSAEAEEGVLMGGVRSAPLPPGRAVVVCRGRPDHVVQFGWSDPP